MKYDLIEIKPNWDDGWMVKFDNTDNCSRASAKKFEPHPLGFFYFPRKWGAEKGFQTLKEDMIQRRRQEIVRLMKDIKELEKLQLPDWIKKSDNR